jgi:hypothetical protein
LIISTRRQLCLESLLLIPSILDGRFATIADR